jgi:hypothetical protein
MLREVEEVCVTRECQNRLKKPYKGLRGNSARGAGIVPEDTWHGRGVCNRRRISSDSKTFT